MSDQNETEAQNAEEARKRRREELMATLAANPRFKIRSGTGEVKCSVNAKYVAVAPPDPATGRRPQFSPEIMLISTA
jgi:hypothetical protein